MGGILGFGFFGGKLMESTVTGKCKRIGIAIECVGVFGEEGG